MVRTLALIPAFSPGEKENHSPRFWNVVQLDWPDNLPPTGNLAPVCPLLGERKQVREVVIQIKKSDGPGLFLPLHLCRNFQTRVQSILREQIFQIGRGEAAGETFLAQHV